MNALTPTMLVALSGALAMLYALIGLFFLKFRSRSGDRLFTLFAAAFLLLAVQRVALTLAREWNEATLWLYGMRLIAFAMILVAILDKNRANRGT